MAEALAEAIDGADPLGDVVDVFDDLHDVAVEFEDRVVGRLEPDFLAAVADPLALLHDVFAAVQARQKS